MTTSRKRRAFTLIELLVVIAIIALLVSILVPSLSQARNLARLAYCGSNLHAVGQATHMYVADTNASEPWWYCNGHDFPWELPRPLDMNITTPQSPATWGNPAVALTRDFTNSTLTTDKFPSLTNKQNYLGDARPFFCPLFNFRYEKHYSRYGHANQYQTDTSVRVWGTYIWMWPKKYNDWGGDQPPGPRSTPTERTYNNSISNNVLMIDYFGYDWKPTWWTDTSLQEYRQGYYHWKAVMLDGSVQTFTKLKDTFSWLWTNQPSDPRQFFDPTYPGNFPIPSYIPG